MRVLQDIAAIAIGSYIIAFGVNEFIVPAHLITSGLAGICVLFYNLFHIPIGTLFLILNIPLLMLGCSSIGKRFTIYTILAVILQSAFLGLLRIPHHLTNDPLLASIYGGIAVGFGAGLILRFDGSAGGFDIVSRVLARSSGIGFGTTSLIFNGLIVVASALVFDIESALYTLISIFVTSKTYDMVLYHMDKVSLIIITNQGEKVAAFLGTLLHTDTAVVNGLQSKSLPKQIVYSVLVNDQLHDVKKGVLNLDPDAVISIIPTRDVIGGHVRSW